MIIKNLKICFLPSVTDSVWSRGKRSLRSDNYSRQCWPRYPWDSQRQRQGPRYDDRYYWWDGTGSIGKCAWFCADLNKLILLLIIINKKFFFSISLIFHSKITFFCFFEIFIFGKIMPIFEFFCYIIYIKKSEFRPDHTKQDSDLKL